ncbi:MAG: hypothetical protein ACR5LF_00485 [Symbiopectobacterium sp.]
MGAKLGSLCRIALAVAALPSLLPNAAVVLMSGAAPARPLGRGLAVELASRRYRERPIARCGSNARHRCVKRFTNGGANSMYCNVLQRPAMVEEQADAALFLIDNTHMTGNTLYCDGDIHFVKRGSVICGVLCTETV